MSLFTLIRGKPTVAQGRKFLSVWNDDGWNKLAYEKPSPSNKPCVKYYDYQYFLRSCKEDITKPLQGVTTGNIPKWLEGSLLQNGPGKFYFGDSHAKHWFDGSALLHKFKVKGGKASYECQFLQSETFKKNTKANRYVVPEFSTPAEPDPCHTVFQRFQAMFTPFVTDNCTVSIYPIDGNLYALTETPKMHKLNVDELNTNGAVDLNKNFKIMSHSAHPHVTKDGTVYNSSLIKGEKGPAYAIYMIPNKSGNGGLEEGKVVAEIPCSWKWNPCYMHSFGLTDNHFIVIEQPLSISIKSIIIRQFLKKGLTDAFRWKNSPVNFHVVQKETGERTVYTSDTFFFFHTINQFEEDGHLVLDICTYDNAEVINGFYVDSLMGEQNEDTLRKMFSGKPLRFVIPLKSEGSGNLVRLPGSKATAVKTNDGTIHLTPEPLCSDFCELPRFNYDNYLGKKYKYFYGITFSDKLPSTGKVIKVDTDKKKMVKEWYEDSTSPSEPIFIPSPGAKDEGDGVLILSLLSSKKPEEVSLVVLDATDFKEISRTVFTTPSPVPKTIHGWFA